MSYNKINDRPGDALPRLFRKERTYTAMTQSKHLHFIGIGGCSMSGLAELMREQG